MTRLEKILLGTTVAISAACTSAIIRKIKRNRMMMENEYIIDAVQEAEILEES